MFLLQLMSSPIAVLLAWWLQNVITVGFVATSLKAPSKAQGTPRTLVACSRKQYNYSPAGFSFGFDITEAFTGAFKTQAQETGPDATATAANSGTRFTVVISGIPSGVTVYLLHVYHKWHSHSGCNYLSDRRLSRWRCSRCDSRNLY